MVISRNRLSMGCVFDEVRNKFSFRRLNGETSSSSPVPNCHTILKRGRFDSCVKDFGCHATAKVLPALAGSAFLRLVCRQDAGCTVGFMESPRGLTTVHRDHEPRAVPRPTESADKSD